MTISPFARLPSLCRLPPAFASLMVLVVICAGPGRAEPGATSVYQRQVEPAPTAESGNAAPATGAAARATAATGEPEDAAAQAERIVLSSAAVIARSQSFSVRFRQKARIGDRVLVGTGRYVQSGQGEEQRFRFDSTLTGDSETFEFTEVSDGLFCWTHRHNGEEAASLQRIDIRRVRSKLAELKAPDAADGASYLGGLQRMIRLLRHWFRFTKATPLDLEGQPVWLVEGSWAADLLPIVLPSLKDRVAQEGGIRACDLPDGMPWQVRIAIGRNDLMPRRIEWLAIPGPRPVADGPLEPIAVLDFHDAEIDGPVDPTAFFYQPASAGLIDVTEMTVGTLGLMR
ncbi:MAG: hypothetical protein KJS77_02335 [Planctomycetes bacterium]|nr:hypothetical protein [Planctomycetota bacterium]